MPGRINLEVAFVTFHDDQFLGTNIVDYKKPNSFILTTGGFPHEILLNTRASSAKFSKLTLTLHDVKDIVIEKKIIDGNEFEVIAERQLQRGGGDDDTNNNNNNAASVSRKQVEVVDLNPETVGKDIRFLKIKLLSGYDDFVGVYSVEGYGEESQQQLAVLESKLEVNL